MAERLILSESGGPIPALPLRSFTIRQVELRTVRHLYTEGHYLHRVRVGRQINYGIFDGESLEGAICYALPMMRTGYFGLRSTQLLEFARLFLVKNKPGLSVFFIALSLRRIKKDWVTKFPNADIPQVVVSWHDTIRHVGTVYKAANFKFYRYSKPRRRGRNKYGVNFAGARTYTQDDAHVKGTWVYPLCTAMRKHIDAFLASKEQPNE